MFLVCFAAHAAEPKQFIFAWPLDEGALKPRGATTRGAPVTLDPAPGEAWKRLTEPGLTAQERDRRAILAMAGPYRVSFDFLEVVRYDPALKPDAPYQSWGTEYVFVAEDRAGLRRSAARPGDAVCRKKRCRWWCATGARNGATRPTRCSPTKA